MEENLINRPIIDLDVPNGNYPYGYFTRLHAVNVRGFKFITDVKALRNGEAWLRLRFGQDERLMTHHDNYNYYTIYRTGRNLTIMSHNEECDMSIKNLCFLFGFYCIKRDKEGSIEYDDDGEIIMTFETLAMNDFLSRLKPVVKYTMVTFLTDEEKEIARNKGFIF